MPGQARRATHPLGKLLIASLPGWLVAVIVAVVLVRVTDLAWWAAAGLVAVWIATDLAMYPRRRRYYTPEASVRRIIGERGEAASHLDPNGFVRVHGELWQAHTAAGTNIREGAPVRVADIHGLELTVEPLGNAGVSASPQSDR